MSLSDTDPDSATYADGAPFMALFGTPAKTKILSVFVAERGRDLSKSDVARQAGISRSTVYEHLGDFLALGVIEKTRTTQDGHSERFQLDDDSDIADTLYELEGLTLGRLLELDPAD